MAAHVTLLLVDDEVIITEMLHDALQDADYAVVVANSGHQATAILDDPSQQIAGIVTDINIGSGPTGWDVARHARALRPDIPVIYMTGGASAEWPIHGVPRSILVGKQFASGQITTAIATLLNAASSNAGLAGG